MTIDEIISLWEVDSEVDRTELAEESLKIPKLHQKYVTIFTKERLILRKYEADMKCLKLDKYEFYTQGPNEETKSKGWKLPAKGLILKSDIPMYMDADEQIIELSLKIGYQMEKIELLESIIRSLNNRGYQIKSAIDFNRFISGVG